MGCTVGGGERAGGPPKKNGGGGGGGGRGCRSRRDGEWGTMQTGWGPASVCTYCLRVISRGDRGQSVDKKV